MIWIVIFRMVIAITLLLYYTHLIVHLLGICEMTYRRITFLRCAIPFYYWIADPNKVD